MKGEMMDERPHNGGAGVGVTHFPERPRGETH